MSAQLVSEPRKTIQRLKAEYPDSPGLAIATHQVIRSTYPLTVHRDSKTLRDDTHVCVFQNSTLVEWETPLVESLVEGEYEMHVEFRKRIGATHGK